MDFRNLNILGSVRIEADFDLAETADKLGVALGDIRFTRDAPGAYDEFPSFTAEAVGFRFVLLGLPDPEEQISDEPITDYTLQISLVSPPETGTVACDASEFFAELIRKTSDLKVSR